MRKIFLLVWACFACTQLAYGQNYTVSATPPPTNIDAQIAFALSDIDLTPVSSGISNITLCRNLNGAVGFIPPVHVCM